MYSVTNDGVTPMHLENAGAHQISVQVVELNDEEIVFDLVGVDASVANALRRILLAEIPSMAVERVYFYDNSSVMQDEVLAHRIGLIPIIADAGSFEYYQDEDHANETDTISFHLEVANESSNPSDIVSVLSKDFTLLQPPLSDFENADGTISQIAPRPVHDDIVITKLAPGQNVHLEAHCVKGIGKDHTKFSPVATASYRLLPHITFPEPVTNELADELKRKCPMDVFDIEDMGFEQRQAIVARPRDCTMCRECIREDGWAQRVKLGRIADHFIFHVETVGVYKPDHLVKKAIAILKEKCTRFLELSGKEQPTRTHTHTDTHTRKKKAGKKVSRKNKQG